VGDSAASQRPGPTPCWSVEIAWASDYSVNVVPLMDHLYVPGVRPFVVSRNPLLVTGAIAELPSLKSTSTLLAPLGTIPATTWKAWLVEALVPELAVRTRS